MPEYCTVTLTLAGQAHGVGLFSLDYAGSDDCSLTLKYPGGTCSAVARDYFEAMCRIRQQLEAEGISLHCYGASRNVYPSGMARDMGRGLQAYKLVLGRPADGKDLVSIFANGHDVQPATVAEQKAWFEAWLRSIA